MPPVAPWLPLIAMLAAGCASAAPSRRATGSAEAVPATRMSADAAPLPSVPLPVELERVLRDYESAWAARSPAALARLFTEDGFVLQSGRPPARGHDAIIRAYTGSGGTLALRALAYTIDGNVGYIVGAYAHGAGRADDGKFILLVRRAPGGAWMIAADMDNSNRPRPAQ